MNHADPYGFNTRFRNASVEDLVNAFNSDVGNQGAVGARVVLHDVLKRKFLATGLDCSCFITNGQMALSHRIRLDGQRFVQVTEAPVAAPAVSESDVAVRPTLYYGVGRHGLLFLEEANALELLAFSTARTWGELRAGAPRLYERGLALVNKEIETPATADDDPFDPGIIPSFSDGDFPDFPEQLMLTFIPGEVQRQFAHVADTVHNGPMLVIDAAAEEGIVAALHQKGFACLKRQDIITTIAGGPTVAAGAVSSETDEKTGQASFTEIARIVEEFKHLAGDERNLRFKQLLPDQRAAVLESLDDAFRLTPDEQRCREAAWALADADLWQKMASSNVIHVVESYRLGHVTFTQAIAGIHRASVGCWAQARVHIVGVTALKLLRTVPSPKTRGQRSPTWPLWIQNATADLILVRQDHVPGVRRSPIHADVAENPADRTSPIIEWALEILTSIGWFGDAGTPTARTIDEWVRRRERSHKDPPQAEDPSR